MYRSAGFISFVLRRVSGVALVIYLFMHMWVIGSITQGSAAFDNRLNMVQSPIFKLLEVALLAAVVYHGLDGARLLIVHHFRVTSYRAGVFYAVLLISALLVVAGALPILIFAFAGD